MTTLILARHAKAEKPSPEVPDHERQLTVEGTTAAGILAGKLSSAGIGIDLALVSSATRSRSTWKAMASAFPEARVHIEDSLYETTVGSIHRMLSELPDGTGNVIVVGHAPVLSATTAWLAGPGSDTPSLKRIAHGLPTGSAAVLEFEGEWSSLGQSSTVLTSIVHSAAQY